MVKISDELTHEHLLPVNEENGFLSIDSIFVFVFKAIFDICVEKKFDVVASLEALIEYLIDDLAV